MPVDRMPDKINWPLWQRIVFRFFFIYLLLYIAPWLWLGELPGVGYITRYYPAFIDWTVKFVNTNFFSEQYPVVHSHTDIPHTWATLRLYLITSLTGCIIWSFIDKEKGNYNNLNYLICLITRYKIAMVAFLYGLIKLVALQMPFPQLSHLATPLGDFLPLNILWNFMGYSASYQIFTGIMETLVGILLLYKRTITFGVLLATAVFTNIMMMNLSYDIPVKQYSINIVLICLFLLANEYRRILCFFILNKAAAACNIYYFSFPKKWMRISRVVLKIVFIIIAVGFPSYDIWKSYKDEVIAAAATPLKPGVYDVVKFAINKDTILPLINDAVRWNDVIFDNNREGSINTSDTAFRQQYKRGYFRYITDTLNHTISFKKFNRDSSFFANFIYEMPDSNTLKLWGKRLDDSLYVELKKSNRHFQLAEKEFHWISSW